MQCIVSTPTNTDTYDNLISVTLPTKRGMSQIKTGHAEYFTHIIAGNMVCITNKNRTMNIEVSEGVCRVVNDIITVVV